MPLSPLYANDPVAILKNYGADSPEMREYQEAHPESDFDKDVSGFIDDIGTGLQNAFYDLTGQVEKTSFYQAQVAREDELIKRQEAREDSAMQRAAADMEAAGLSRYGLSGGAAGSSAGGSSNVHSGSNVDFGAMLDILKAKSEIENVQANTNKTNAEAAATTAGVERDDNYYALAAQKQDVDIARIALENELTKSQTAETAAHTISIIDANVRAQESHLYELVAKNVENQLKYKELNAFDETHEAEMAVKRTSAYLNQQRAGEAYEHQLTYQKQREEIVKEMERIASQIAKEKAEALHLSYQDQLLVQDYAYRQLETIELQYNYDYSVNHNLRTSDPVSRIGGVNMDQFVTSLGDLGDWTSKFTFGHSSSKSGGHAW